MIPRTVIQNHGYREVSVAFRRARALAIEAQGISERTDRTVCPAIDAARQAAVYGSCPMPTTDEKGLRAFAQAFDLSFQNLRVIASFSGPWHKIWSNYRSTTFDDKALNGGFHHSVKSGISAGIIATGTYRQDVMNEFLWHLFPELKGTPMDKDFLMDANDTSPADDLFLTTNHVDAIMEWNHAQSTSSNHSLVQRAGSAISKAEFATLLLTKLGSPIPAGDEGTVDALSVRDFHDLYKYGVFPVRIEESMLQLGLIDPKSLALTAAGPTKDADRRS